LVAGITQVQEELCAFRLQLMTPTTPHTLGGLGALNANRVIHVICWGYVETFAAPDEMNHPWLLAFG